MRRRRRRRLNSASLGAIAIDTIRDRPKTEFERDNDSVSFAIFIVKHFFSAK